MYNSLSSDAVYQNLHFYPYFACVNSEDCMDMPICPFKQNFDYKIVILISYLLVKTCVLGAQKNCLNETVLLSTKNTCFGLEIRKIFFNYVFKSRV